MALNNRELATILAALRYWQREGLMSAGAEHDIATDGDTLREMNADEIDSLCERLNTVPTIIGLMVLPGGKPYARDT